MAAGSAGFSNFFLPSAEAANATSTPTATVSLAAPPGQTQAKPETTGQTAPTPSAQPTRASSSSHTVEISAGVGVPLGIIFLSSLGYIIWSRSGKHLNKKSEVDGGQQTSNHEARRNGLRAEQYEMSSRVAPQGLEYAGYWPGELHSTPVHEAADAF